MFCNSNLPETRDGRLIQANPWGPWAPVATLPMPNAPMGASYTTWRGHKPKCHDINLRLFSNSLANLHMKSQIPDTSPLLYILFRG